MGLIAMKTTKQRTNDLPLGADFSTDSGDFMSKDRQVGDLPKKGCQPTFHPHDINSDTVCRQNTTDHAVDDILELHQIGRRDGDHDPLRQVAQSDGFTTVKDGASRCGGSARTGVQGDTAATRTLWRSL